MRSVPNARRLTRGLRGGIVAVWAGVAVGVSVFVAVAEGARPVHAAATRTNLVATVRSVSRPDIWVKPSAGGPLKALSKGDVLYLHDIVAAGPGVAATLALTLPAGLPANTVDLLDFYKQLSAAQPAAGAVVKEFFVAPQSVRTDRTLKLTRSGTFITLTLSP